MIDDFPRGIEGWKHLDRQQVTNSYIDFNELESARDKTYHLKGWTKVKANAGLTQHYIRCNNDTTAGHYQSEFLNVYGTTVSAVASAITNYTQLHSAIASGHTAVVFWDVMVNTVPTNLDGGKDYTQIMSRVDVRDTTSNTLYFALESGIYSMTSDISQITIGLDPVPLDVEMLGEITTPINSPIGSL